MGFPVLASAEADDAPSRAKPPWGETAHIPRYFAHPLCGRPIAVTSAER